VDQELQFILCPTQAYQDKLEMLIKLHLAVEEVVEMIQMEQQEEIVLGVEVEMEVVEVEVEVEEVVVVVVVEEVVVVVEEVVVVVEEVVMEEVEMEVEVEVAVMVVMEVKGETVVLDSGMEQQEVMALLVVTSPATLETFSMRHVT
jgi:hypothetical protein